MTVNELRTKIDLWEALHLLQLKAEKVEDRTEARHKRDLVSKELESLGFTICYVDGGGVLALIIL